MNNYHIGTGIAEVTDPAIGAGMQGFARKHQKTTGIESDLYARAFIIWDPNTDRRVVIAVVDIWSCTQAVKEAVVDRLQVEYGDIYAHDNVLISGTHTHSGPGGYSHYHLYNYSIGGFDPHTFECIVSGIVQSIRRAHDRLAPGKIYLNQGILEKCGWQRSVEAYENNPQAERRHYDSDTDQTMVVLKFCHVDGGQEVAIGMLNWYAMHPTNCGQHNTFITGDNKGYAAQRFETEMDRDSAAPVPFVAAFANANAGDVSGNVAFGHIPNGIDDLKNMRLHGEKQFRKAKALFDAAKIEVTGSIDFRHTYVDMAQATGLPGALGLSTFAGSTEDGDTGSRLREGILEGESGVIDRVMQRLISRGLALQLAKFGIKTVSVRSLPISMVQGHWPKPVTFAPGLTAPYPTTPNILPLQLLKIGMTVIAGIPAELTTMAGRRLRTAILGEMEEVGVTLCALATYANGYSQYITTKEEYDKQHYEGASVLFGPQTLAVYIEHYRQLTQQLQRGERIQTGLRPPYLFNTIPVLRRLTVRNLSASSISVSFFKQSSRLMLWSFAKTKIAPNRDQVIVLPRHIDQAKARLSNRQIIEQIRIHDLVTITIDGIAVISKYSPPAYPTSQDGVYPM